MVRQPHAHPEQSADGSQPPALAATCNSKLTSRYSRGLCRGPVSTLLPLHSPRPPARACRQGAATERRPPCVAGGWWERGHWAHQPAGHKCPRCSAAACGAAAAPHPLPGAAAGGRSEGLGGHDAHCGKRGGADCGCPTPGQVRGQRWLAVPRPGWGLQLCSLRSAWEAFAAGKRPAAPPSPCCWCLQVSRRGGGAAGRACRPHPRRGQPAC